jgi:hypothetical protein
MVTYGDVLTLCSAITAISAVCIAVDSLYITRLMGHREAILGKCDIFFDKHLRVSEKNTLSDAERIFLSEMHERVSITYDEVKKRDFIASLSTLIFFNGTIVRAMATTISGSIFLIFLSVLYANKVPFLTSIISLNYLTYYACPADSINCNQAFGTISFLVSLILVYLGLCLVWYLNLWTKQFDYLKKCMDTVTGELERIKILI